VSSTNGHGPKRVLLYARVSTDEQAKSGYSLAQQIEALRQYALREGYQILEEVQDPGQSGASLARPGMDRVRDLVAAGGILVVLAQDRDRFAREPAYHYLLKREFEEHGCKIRALNDRGDDSPEGQLTDGILDQLGKYERAKLAERSRRGKMRKAREGKVLAGPLPNFGFRYNETRDGYEVDEEAMSVVRRIFLMVGTEGVSTHMAARILEAEGVRSPAGGRYWYKLVVKRLILDDVYKPHAFEEVEPFVSTEVAVRLDPNKCYGVWWFGRRRTSSTQVSEANPDGNGRTYRKKTRVEARDKGEWIAVPVPDAGIPREWVDAARAVASPTTEASRRPPTASGSSPAASQAAESAGRLWRPTPRCTEPDRVRRRSTTTAAAWGSAARSCARTTSAFARTRRMRRSGSWFRACSKNRRACERGMRRW